MTSAGHPRHTGAMSTDGHNRASLNKEPEATQPDTRDSHPALIALVGLLARQAAAEYMAQQGNGHAEKDLTNG